LKHEEYFQFEMIHRARRIVCVGDLRSNWVVKTKEYVVLKNLVVKSREIGM
jgi:hypothetical protein